MDPVKREKMRSEQKDRLESQKACRQREAARREKVFSPIAWVEERKRYILIES